MCHFILASSSCFFMEDLEQHFTWLDHLSILKEKKYTSQRFSLFSYTGVDIIGEVIPSKTTLKRLVGGHYMGID
eukprot:snap_masked-scaffold_9-processed-gene-13.72-mRNA-1 protein AED:1.00 eAED:1.00 QI:0/0/0/0/1/1/2/0/73